MDQNIRERRFTATFTPTGDGYAKATKFDVTKEIVALGGIIPKADPNGTDVLLFSENAPEHVRNYRGEYLLEVNEQ